jgi:hypothetical protein
MNGEGHYESARQSDIPIMNYDKWEPGYTQVVNARVVNKGSLALAYELEVVADGILEALLNNAPLLSDVIDVYYATEEVLTPTRADLDAAIAANELPYIGTLTQLLLGGTLIKDHLLPAGADPAHGESEHYATLVLIMKSEVGMEYQGLTVGNESFAHDGRFHACGGGGRVFGSLCRHGVEVYTECLYTSHAVGQVDVEQDSAEVEYDDLNHDYLVVFDVYVHLREWNFDA